MNGDPLRSLRVGCSRSERSVLERRHTELTAALAVLRAKIQMVRCRADPEGSLL
ncbi:MAG: hypothetical protein ABSH51_06170 [Solirubrobacteraceae bacterium]